MPKQKHWFRLYTEVTQDHKLRRIPPAQRWVWIAVLSLSRRSPVPGRLLLSENCPVTLDDIADEAHVDREEVEAAVAWFLEKEMLRQDGDTLVVINWGKRQYESDSSTKRVQAWREKQQAAKADVTAMKRYNDVPCNVTVTPPEIRLTETETSTPDGVDTAKATPPASSKTPNGAQATPSQQPNRVLWSAFAKALGEGPLEGERGKWNTGIGLLLKDGVTPEEVPRLVERYQAEYPGLPCNPRAIASNLSFLRGPPRARAPNGKSPPRRAVDRESIAPHVSYAELYRKQEANERDRDENGLLGSPTRDPTP